jgi:hypothetical protein
MLAAVSHGITIRKATPHAVPEADKHQHERRRCALWFIYMAMEKGLNEDEEKKLGGFWMK